MAKDLSKDITNLGLLDSICIKCSEAQRNECNYTNQGCDEFYKWRSNHVEKILKAGEKLKENSTNTIVE